MNLKIEKAKKLKILNEMAVKGQKVIFGSSFMNGFPFYEIIQKRVTDYVVYNRSIEDLTVAEAIETCEDCLKNLEPQNIIISFGENEERNERFFDDYRILIIKIRKMYKYAKIALVNILDDVVFDQRVSGIARENKIEYIKLEPKDTRMVFNKLSAFLRNGEINFYDAINIMV